MALKPCGSKCLSPHADSACDPQYAQSSVGNAQTMRSSQPDVDPCDPQDAQTSTRNAQTKSEASLILIHAILHGVEPSITDYSKLLHASA